MSTILSNNHYLFTSESVSEGHPDKLCDQVSDAILDACLEADPQSHVACETYATTGMVLVGGEITTHADVDFQKVVRDVVRDIGYTNEDYGISADTMAVLNTIHNQYPDINQGVVGTGLKEYEGQQGAGDQGIMFGFATNETPEYMPATLVYAHKILKRAAELRKNGTIKWLRPDSKSQVTIEYDENHKPVRIDAVVVSHQHNPDVDYDTIKKTIIDEIIKPVLEPTGLLDSETKYYINPTGRFVVGGEGGFHIDVCRGVDIHDLDTGIQRFLQRRIVTYRHFSLINRRIIKFALQLAGIMFVRCSTGNIKLLNLRSYILIFCLIRIFS